MSKEYTEEELKIIDHNQTLSPDGSIRPSRIGFGLSINNQDKTGGSELTDVGLTRAELATLLSRSSKS